MGGSEKGGRGGGKSSKLCFYRMMLFVSATPRVKDILVATYEALYVSSKWVELKYQPLHALLLLAYRNEFCSVSCSR